MNGKRRSTLLGVGLVLALAFGLDLIPQIASASFPNQSNFGALSTQTSGGNISLVQDLKGIASGTVTGVTVRLLLSGVSEDYLVAEMCSYPPGGTPCNNNVVGGRIPVSQVTTGTAGFYTFTFTSPFILDPTLESRSSTLMIGWAANATAEGRIDGNGAAGLIKAYGTSSDVFPGAYLYGNPVGDAGTSWGSVTQDATVKQIYMNWGLPSGASIVFPVNGTTTNDFADWIVNFSNNSSTGFFRLRVSFDTSSSTLWTGSASTSTGGMVEISSGSSGNHIVSKGYIPLATSTTYFAQARVYRIPNPAFPLEDTLVVSSDVISFTTTGVASVNPYYSATSSPNFQNTSTYPFANADFGFLGNAVRDALLWLFTPSQSALGTFSNLKSQYQNKPPFGYFTAIYNAVGLFSEGTATSTPMTASTTAALALVFSPFKSAFSILLWFLFAFWLVSRMKHLEL